MSDFVIWSFEHNAWWAPLEQGYTTSLKQAGRYSAEDAGRIVTNSIFLEELAIDVHVLSRYDNKPPEFHPYGGKRR